MRFVVVVVALVAGCVRPEAVTCGDRLCPPAYTCDGATGTCIPPGCGDGEVGPTEECDGAASVEGTDCRDFGYYTRGEALACTPQCTFDLATCATIGRCGDAIVNGPELCDGAPPANLSCTDFGFGVGRLGCGATCTPTFAACSKIGGRIVGRAPESLLAIAGGNNEAYAVGEQGVILRSVGSGWFAMPSPTTVDLRAVWVGRGETMIAYAGGGDGVVLQLAGDTSQASWVALPAAPVDAIQTIWAAPEGLPLFVGGGRVDGTIAIWDGTVWSTPSVFPGSDAIRGITGSNGGTLVAVGRNGLILRRTTTTDWATIVTAACPIIPPPLASTCDLRAVTAVDGMFYAVGTNGGTAGVESPILASTNGTSWTTIASRTEVPLFAVDGPSTDELLIGGREGTLLRFDGVVMHEVASETFDTITGIWVSRAISVRTTHTDGAIRLQEGIAWHDAGQIAAISSSINLLATESVQLSDGRTETLAGGELKTAARTFDGVTWTVVPTTGGGDAITGFASAPSGRALASTERIVGLERGTLDASLDPIGLIGRGLAIWAPSATDAIIVGGSNNSDTRAWHRTAGTWTARMIPGAGVLNGVWGAQPTDVWAVGDAGTLAHFDGATWSLVTSGATENLRGVWGTSGSDVFAVGFGGTILHYDGTAWRRQAASTELFFGVRGTAWNDVFAFGEDSLYHYDGVAWSRVALPMPYGVRGMSVRTEGQREELVFVGTDRHAATLWRFGGSEERECDDGWDEDRDGAVDCADPDCRDTNACKVGGACLVVARATCGTTIAGTTYTGVARVDAWPVLDELTTGPEAAYKLFEVDGRVTVTLEGAAGLQLLVVATHPNTNACDVRRVIASGANTLTFDAVATERYAIVVDSPGEEPAAPLPALDNFTLTIACE